MVAPNYPSKEELSESFYLDHVNGREEILRRKGKSVPADRIVECKNNSKGYCRVPFKLRHVYYHTIMWILHNGDIEGDLMIDHINGDKVDNRIENLRLLDNRGNQQNTTRQRKGRKLVGTCQSKRDGRWISKIATTGDNTHIHLGLYDTEEEAHEMYLKALAILHTFNGDKEEFRRAVSGYRRPESKGYSYCKDRGNWEVYVDIDKRRVGIGRCETEQQAVALSTAAKKLSGLYTGDKKEFRALVKGAVNKENEKYE
jgi:hypothetical protein